MIPFKTYLVNLPKRKDRFNKIIGTINDNFASFEVVRPVSLENAMLYRKIEDVRGFSDAEISHFMTFRRIMSKQIKEADDYFIIVEDDAVFNPHFFNKFDELFTDFKRLNGDLLYLGGFHDKGLKLSSDLLCRMEGTLETTFCLFKREFAIKFLEIIESPEFKFKQTDVVLMDMMRDYNCFISRTIYVQQDSGYSDIKGINLDNRKNF